MYLTPSLRRDGKQGSLLERWETGFTAGEIGNTGFTAGETEIRVHCWRDMKHMVHWRRNGNQGSLLERWKTQGSLLEKWETGFTAGEMGNTGFTAGEMGNRVHCWRDGNQGSLLRRWGTGFTAGDMGNTGFPGLDHCSEVVLRSSAFQNAAFSFGKIVCVEPLMTAKETNHQRELA